MQVHEAFLIEELVDGEGHGVADAEDGTEGVGPEAHVRYAAEELQGGVLLLERETHGVAFAQHFHFRGLDLHGLPAAHGGHQLALHGQGGPCGDALEEVFAEEFRIGYDLDIVDGRTVVEGNEFDLFVSPLGADPAFCEYLSTRLGGEQCLDFGSFDSFHSYLYVNRTKITLLFIILVNEVQVFFAALDRIMTDFLFQPVFLRPGGGGTV